MSCSRVEKSDLEIWKISQENFFTAYFIIFASVESILCGFNKKKVAIAENLFTKSRLRKKEKKIKSSK